MIRVALRSQLGLNEEQFTINRGTERAINVKANGKPVYSRSGPGFYKKDTTPTEIVNAIKESFSA